MPDNKEQRKKAEVRKPQANCETCEFYDYDEFEDAYVCNIALDQDDMVDFISHQTRECPYYRYYDEYKSVHKQI